LVELGIDGVPAAPTRLMESADEIVAVEQSADLLGTELAARSGC